MKLKALLMATCLLLPMSSAFADSLDSYISDLTKEADIGNMEAKKELNNFLTQRHELEEKAKAGNAEAQYKLALLYKKYNSRDEEAKQLTLQSANQGYVDAQRAMFLLAIYNYRVTKNTIKYRLKKDTNDYEEKKKKYEEEEQKFYQEMMGWVDKLFAARDADTAIFLGDAYMKGQDGLQKNYIKAKEMYEKAVDFGSVKAIYKLVNCYEKGLGVDKDISKVISLYEEAGRKGDAAGYAKLYIMYDFGLDGLAQDQSKAQEYKRKKCAIEPNSCQ